MNKQEIEARRFVTLIKQWIMEARAICFGVKEPEECRKIMEEMFELIKKFEDLIRR